jgi:hypothetical protein
MNRPSPSFAGKTRPRAPSGSPDKSVAPHRALLNKEIAVPRLAPWAKDLAPCKQGFTIRLIGEKKPRHRAQHGRLELGNSF